MSVSSSVGEDDEDDDENNEDAVSADPCFVTLSPMRTRAGAAFAFSFSSCCCCTLPKAVGRAKLEAEEEEEEEEDDGGMTTVGTGTLKRLQSSFAGCHGTTMRRGFVGSCPGGNSPGLIDDADAASFVVEDDEDEDGWSPDGLSLSLSSVLFVVVPAEAKRFDMAAARCRKLPLPGSSGRAGAGGATVDLSEVSAAVVVVGGTKRDVGWGTEGSAGLAALLAALVVVVVGSARGSSKMCTGRQVRGGVSSVHTRGASPPARFSFSFSFASAFAKDDE